MDYDEEELEALEKNQSTTDVTDVISIYDDLLNKLETNQRKKNIAVKEHNKQVLEEKRKEKVNEIVQIVLGQRGKQYVWGAAGPNTFDCSGLMQWSFGKCGYTLPRVAADQAQTGKHLKLSELKKGDMVFFKADKEDPNRVSHVGLYLGDGKFIHAPDEGDVVKISRLNGNYANWFCWGVRVIK